MGVPIITLKKKIGIKSNKNIFLNKNAEQQLNIANKKDYSIKVHQLATDNFSEFNSKIKAEDIKNFQEIKIIGHGRSAIISLVIDTISNEKYAFKNFFKAKDLYNELNFFTQVPEHCNIVKCFGVYYIKEQQGLLLEYIPGFTFSKVTEYLCQQYSDNKLSHINFWGTIQYLIRNLLLAIKHMHDYDFAHQDIRPSNILIDQNKLEPIVIDFNLARHNGEILSPGKEEYAPPEFFTSNGKYRITETSDSYSIGQLLYSILFYSISPDTKNVFIAGAKINDLKSCERLAMIYRLRYALRDYTKTDDKGEYKKAIKAIKSSEIINAKLGKQYEQTPKLISNNTTDKQHLVGFYPEDYESHVVKFINEMLHPNPQIRLTVEHSLSHDFIKEQIINVSVAKNIIQHTITIIGAENQLFKNLYQDHELKLNANLTE